MPKVTFDSKEVDAVDGSTLLDAALDNDVDLDHNCGGNCACSTCHIIIEEGMDNLSEMTEDEEDMLDTAAGLTLTSRLACQCQIMGEGAVKIKIPPKSDY